MRRYFLVVTVCNSLLFFSLFLVSLPIHADPVSTPTPTPSAQPNNNGFFEPGDTSHPLKLNFPFSWVGELKLPSREEIASRNKLELLDDLTDQQIRSELEKWAPYNNMSLGDQGRMLTRIQDFRDRRTKIAMEEAQRLSLTNLAPADQMAFKKMFWKLQSQVDDQLIAEFQNQYDAKEHEMEHELASQFAPLVPSRTPTPVRGQAPAKVMQPVTGLTVASLNPVPTPSAQVAPAKVTGTPKPASKPKPKPTPKPKPSPTPSPSPAKQP